MDGAAAEEPAGTLLVAALAVEFAASEADMALPASSHRVVTSYLPPLLGFFSVRWLQRAGYL